MPRETIFFAQSFRVDGRKLIASALERHRSQIAAVQSATRMAASKAGAMAFQVTGDPEFDDYDDPVMLFQAGRLPKEFGQDD